MDLGAIAQRKQLVLVQSCISNKPSAIVGSDPLLSSANGRPCQKQVSRKGKMSTLVCSEIRCPWWSSLSQNYGCQRYALSRCCHLLEVHKTEFSENEYALYADSPDQQLIKQWKAEGYQH